MGDNIVLVGASGPGVESDFRALRALTIGSEHTLSQVITAIAWESPGGPRLFKLPRTVVAGQLDAAFRPPDPTDPTIAMVSLLPSAEIAGEVERRMARRGVGSVLLHPKLAGPEGRPLLNSRGILRIQALAIRSSGFVADYGDTLLLAGHSAEDQKHDGPISTPALARELQNRGIQRGIIGPSGPNGPATVYDGDEMLSLAVSGWHEEIASRVAAAMVLQITGARWLTAADATFNALRGGLSML